jgi:phage terminase large subunit-like protein
MADTQEIDNFRGADLDVLWVDEECSEEVFDECVTRLADRNGLAIISMTPHKGFTWTYKRLVRPAQFSPDIRHFIFRTIDNYHINRVEFVKSAALMSDREFQIRIKGKRIANEGLVYSMFDEKVHVVRPFNMDAFDHEGKKPQLFIGVDFGLNNPTGASIWGVMPNKKRYIMDEYYQEGFTVKQNAENLADKMKKYNLKLRWITVDPNDGAKRSEQTNERNVDVFKKNFCRAYGKQVPVFMGNRGVGVIEHRIDKMNEMLSVINGEPNLQVFSNCLNHIDEFSSYAFPNRKNEELNRYEKPKEYKNHLMNAAEYVAERNPHVAATQDFSIVNRMYNYDPTGLVRC